MWGRGTQVKKIYQDCPTGGAKMMLPESRWGGMKLRIKNQKCEVTQAYKCGPNKQEIQAPRGTP